MATEITKTVLFLGFTAALIIGVFLFVEPVPQDLAYHAFADKRTMLAIANFWNVSSNLPFLFVGGAGIWYFATTDRATLDSKIETKVYPAYIVFFLGVLLTCFGSGWFHLAPGNGTLVWDRLPMTLAFMGLFTVVVGEHISPTNARRLFWPLLLVGAGSVFYWDYTESQGMGDLRPYAFVQFLPMLLIPTILLIYPSRFGSSRFYWGMLAAYVASKLFEHFDQSVFDTLQFMSGHAIKHMAAAVAPAVFLYGIASRKPRRAVKQQD